MRTLSDLISLLEREGELVRVRARVSPILEIPAIAHRLSRCPAPHAPSPSARATDPAHHHLGGPAVLFENVDGSDIPVLINALGSYRRMELALGRSFQQIADQIADIVKPQPPRSLREAIAKARRLAPLLRIAPKRTRRADHHERILLGDDIDLTRLPLIRCWPLDGDLAAVGWPEDINHHIPGVSRGQAWNTHHRGRYITLGGIHTIHADDRDARKPPSHNIGMYRVQLLGPRCMAMHWHIHHDGAAHWRSWKALGRPMPVAIALGGEPVLPYAATAPLPPGISELLMAGLLARRPIRLARAKTVPLWVPAHADIVIEGFVSHEAGPIGFTPPPPTSPGPSPDLHEPPPGPGAVIEGPFGDHTGFYSLPDRYPILTVTAVTTRSSPIYPTTVVGLPPQEDYFLGKATERIFLPLLKTLIHDIDDYNLPMFGAFHNCAMVRIRKQYPLHARRTMHAIWGAGQMSWTKCLFITDHDTDIHDAAAVLRAAGRHCHPARDIEMVRGPLDILDHAAPSLGAGSKIGLDCTPRRRGEHTPGPVSLNQPAADTPDGPPEGPPDGKNLERLREALAQAATHIPGLHALRLHEHAPSWLFLQADHHANARDIARHARHAIAAVAARAHTPPRFAIVLGRGVDLADSDACLFHWLANMDPGRDTFHPIQEAPHAIVFDATPKTPGGDHPEPVRDWPPILAVDPETARLVERRWPEYGLDRFKPVRT